MDVSCILSFSRVPMWLLDRPTTRNLKPSFLACITIMHCGIVISHSAPKWDHSRFYHEVNCSFCKGRRRCNSNVDISKRKTSGSIKWTAVTMMLRRTQPRCANMRHQGNECLEFLGRVRVERSLGFGLQSFHSTGSRQKVLHRVPTESPPRSPAARNCE